jgi:hypothetical protein
MLFDRAKKRIARPSVNDILASPVQVRPQLLDEARAENIPNASKSVLYLLNNGVSYGGLYSYDHVFSDDPTSPLHRSNVVVMGRNGGPSNSQGVRLGFPDPGSRIRQLVTAVKLFVQAALEFGRRYPVKYLWTLSRMCAAADGQRMALKRDLPALKLAILAYDLQVPGEVLLALESMGLRTVALNERPQSVVWEMQPFAASILLTASDTFSAFALASRSVSVGQVVSVGMWRTDFLCEYRLQQGHALQREARRKGLKFIVALPFHASEEGEAGSSPLETSPQAVRHFLLDLVNIAEESSKVFIVIRGKNDLWVKDERFADVVQSIDRISNIVISRDYDTLNESYRLCAWADLVLAKHTSLVDEVLSVGIPCVIHDYTTNSSDLSRLLVPYLPREIWAEDARELRQRVEFALAGEGRQFTQWWEPHRRRIYSDLNDGHVRVRARAFMASLAEGGNQR